MNDYIDIVMYKQTSELEQMNWAYALVIFDFFRNLHKCND
jgi:hypothetical protein